MSLRYLSILVLLLLVFSCSKDGAIFENAMEKCYNLTEIKELKVPISAEVKSIEKRDYFFAGIHRFLEVERKEIEDGFEFSSPKVRIFAPGKKLPEDGQMMQIKGTVLECQNFYILKE